MSMKCTLAHGENWHLYEDLSIRNSVFLTVDSTTLALTKPMLQAILPALTRLEAKNWKLIGDEEVTEEQIDDFIEVLKDLGKQNG